MSRVGVARAEVAQHRAAGEPSCATAVRSATRVPRAAARLDEPGLREQTVRGDGVAVDRSSSRAFAPEAASPGASSRARSAAARSAISVAVAR
jgi:hypothetical protein